MNRAYSEKFLPLRVDPALEIVINLDSEWDGVVRFDPEVVRGARVKPVYFVAPDRVEFLDRAVVLERALAAGATYCHPPVINVLRVDVKRDERHSAGVSLEASLRMFAEETKVRAAEKKIAAALELAIEADHGVTE